MPSRAPRWRGATDDEGARAGRPGSQAAHRAEARRRDEDIAPYRNETAPRGTARGHGQRGTQSERIAKPRTAPGRGGAMRTSRPTATRPHHGARRGGARARERGARQGREAWAWGAGNGAVAGVRTATGHTK